MIDESIPATVAHKMLIPSGVVTARPIAPGMSGASVWRCVTSTGQSMALKCWPRQTTAQRVGEVHRLMQHASENGCQLVPSIHRGWSPERNDSFLVSDGRCFDLVQWRSGSATTSDAAEEQIQSGAAAIAQFHGSVRALGVWSQPPPAILTRLRRIDQLTRLIPQALTVGRDHTSESELDQMIGRACRLFWERWDEVRSHCRRNLARYAQFAVPTQYVLRDVHRDHVLFEGSKVSGLIDFDAARVDTPTTDLARWAGSFLLGRAEKDKVWEAAMAGFCLQNTLFEGCETEIDPKMAKDLCHATIWISLANWLVWILCQKRTFPAGPWAVARRIDELVSVASESD